MDESKSEACDTCIHRPFEAQTVQTPRAIAVVADGRTLTYCELNRRANQVAHHLLALGVGPEVPVAICMERSIEMVVGMLGILKAGGVYVPLDPAYPPLRLAFMLEDTRAPVLLADRRLASGLPAHGAHTVELDATWTALEGEGQENPRANVEPHNLAYIIYTSGSTGKPKGVCVPHDAALQHFATMQDLWELSAADRVLAFASFSFDASLEQIFPTLYSGATVVLRGADGWGAGEFSRTARALRLTVADLPTAYWDQWVQACHLDGDRPPLPDLRLVAIGGEAARAETVRRWGETPMRSIRLVNAYGPTETTITASIQELTPCLGGDAPLERVPIGRPLPGRTMHILDQHGDPVLEGEAGELYIGGAGLARGYLGRPDLTAERFVPHPFGAPGERLYRSGDIGRYRPDGAIEFLGRVDHQVKLRGFRIELGEIEEVLGRHPAVRTAIVLVRDEATGDRRLAAHVVLHASRGVTANDLTDYLKTQLPDYMMPAVLVLHEELPVNAAGKVDRGALASTRLSRETMVDRSFVAPSLTIHHQLVHIWEELLNVRPIGIRDNFFELGGHSLLAVRLIDQIERECGRRLPLSTLFTDATIDHLAQALLSPELGTGHGKEPALVKLQDGTKRPFFYLHGDLTGGGLYCLSLARYLGEEQPFYVFHPGRLRDRPVLPTIEAVAKQNLLELQAVQPEGPYLLGGFCDGGVVAFEIARQLRAQGQTVELLFMIDAMLPGRRLLSMRASSLISRLAHFARRDPEKELAWYLRLRPYVAYWHRLRRSDRATLWCLTLRHTRRGVRRISSHLASWFARRDRHAPDGSQPAGTPQRDILGIYAWAESVYDPGWYAGKVVLALSDEARGWRDGADPTLGWCNLAEEVEVFGIPGAHLTCVTQHIAALATELRKRLDLAQSDSDRKAISHRPGGAQA